MGIIAYSPVGRGTTLTRIESAAVACHSVLSVLMDRVVRSASLALFWVPAVLVSLAVRIIIIMIMGSVSD